jgi:uncharacterized protein YbbK (DUF523 family)
MAADKSNNSSQLFPELRPQVSKEAVLSSACFLGIPCRWHGRRARKRDKLIAKLQEKYILVPVCPEQLGGMPGEVLKRAGIKVVRVG